MDDPAKPTQRRAKRLSSAERRAMIEDAASACIAGGGIRAFTVDKVAAEAGVSRGLLMHHFGSMEGLLVAVYDRMYRDWLDMMSAPRPGLSRIEAIVEALVSPRLFGHDALKIWLTLWAEIANHPVLRDAHRRLLAGYRATIAEAMRDEARANGATIDADAAAIAFVCLIDGLAVQRCVDPGLMSEPEARAICRAFLDPLMGRRPPPA